MVFTLIADSGINSDINSELILIVLAVIFFAWFIWAVTRKEPPNP